MPRANPLQASFNGGEFSPRMTGRVDIAQYQNAAETALNLLALPQGGFARRPGTRFVSEVKSSAVKTRILPFQASVALSYIIEAGANNFRFYRNQANVISDATDAVVTNGDFTSGISSWANRSTGAASIAHDATNGRLSLVGSGADVSHAEQVVGVGAAFANNDHVVRFTVHGAPGDKIRLRIGTTSTGSQVLSDEEYGVGYHSREFVPGATTFYLQFLHAAGKTIQVDDVDFLSDDQIEIATPYTESDLPNLKTAQTADVMYIVGDVTQPVYKLLRYGHLSWSLERVFFADGPYFDANIENTSLTPSAASGNGVTITASTTTGINDGRGFLSTDVGRLIRIQHGTNEPGYGIVVQYNSNVSVVVDVKRNFNATTASTNWSLGQWSDTSGYPSAIAFYEQRLAFANNGTRPQTLWMSQAASIENFRPDSFVSGAVTVEDDDALSFTIAAREFNAILWMSSEKILVLGTSGGEWVVTSQGATLTPTDIGVRRHSTNGSYNAQSLLVNSVTLFIQRARRKIFDYQFVFQQDRFDGNDVTIFADHVTSSGVTEMHYQQQPDSLVWVLRTDGIIPVLTYNQGQAISGWTRLKLGGSFGSGHAVVESIAIIPGGAGGGRTYDSDERDEVWVVVKRTINGQTKRYIEFFEGLFEGPIQHDYETAESWESALLEAQKDAFYVDSGLTYDGAPTDTLSGLSHLEGETLKVLADGAIHPDATVSGGQISLAYEASKVHVGLPYKHIYKSLKINVGAAAGTAVGKKKRIHGITFVLLDTATFQYGRNPAALQRLEFREVADSMDTAVPLFTGERHTEFGGEWSRDARLTVESENPSPFFLLALAPEVKTNESL